MPPLTSPGPAFSRPRAHRRHPQQNPQLTTITAPATEIFPDRLTIIYLRWLCSAVTLATLPDDHAQIGPIWRAANFEGHGCGENIRAPSPSLLLPGAVVDEPPVQLGREPVDVAGSARCLS